VITAKFDRPKLEKSLKKYAKQFGDTTAQAVVRWGVQTCRELAFETQVWGRQKAKKGSAGSSSFPWAKGKQEGAIIADALKVVLIVPRVGKSRKALQSAADVNAWIELNRTSRRARTAKLPISAKKECSEATFKAAMKIRFKHAGMAKGGWLDAGKKMAEKQTGADKINIGKNFMGWAQRSGKGFGAISAPKSTWRPSADITNKVGHVATSYVLARDGSQKAINFGLKKTVQFYRRALAAIDKKTKP
jgi:hypothetical protein